MKPTTPLLILSLFPVPAMALDTISRPWTRDGTNYMVNFMYDPHGPCSIPATNPPGQPHFPCRISVWAGGVQVGTNFTGEVTVKGCFEDRPEDAVAKALSQAIKPTKK